jgi:SAM-dependent methyltransferase
MTIWDKIYKEYKDSGKKWASLFDDVSPMFKQFLKQSYFEVKYVLDIGCGTGKYLKLLKEVGFKTDGIDSSETAVEFTKKILGVGSNILCVDMYDYNIPKNKYDLIISIATIHHGDKKQVQAVINKIHKALVKNGKIFISVPDLESGKKWHTFVNNKEIAKGTYIPLSGPEKGLLHSFYTKEEAEKLFSKFKDVQIDLDQQGRWIVRGRK